MEVVRVPGPVKRECVLMACIGKNRQSRIADGCVCVCVPRQLHEKSFHILIWGQMPEFGWGRRE